MTLTQLIARTPVLASAEPAVVQYLANHATLRNLRRGEVLWQAGDTSDFWAILRTGLVKLVRRAPHGRTAICGLHGSPDCIGELAVLRGAPYSTSAIAATAAVGVVIVPRAALLDCVRQHPALGLAFARHAHDELVRLEHKIDVLSAGGVEARLSAALLELYEELGDDFEDGSSSIPVNLSRRELADIVSTSVETAIRVMTRWEREGLLTTDARGFTLYDKAALQALAGYPVHRAAE